MISKEDKIKTLAGLARDAENKHDVDWSTMPMKRDEAFIMMASNVIEQIDSLEEKDKTTVAMATITKLLVDNFVLSYQLKNGNKDV